MNITNQLSPLKPQQIQKFSPYVSRLYLNPQSYKLNEINTLTKSQKITITKLYKNINILCKLSKKQIKQLFKQLKQYQIYQDLLTDFFFQHKINNYILINKQQANVKIQTNVLRKSKQNIINYGNNNANLYNKNQKQTKNKFSFNKCLSIEYRIQFTISNINKKKVMKPVVLLAYTIQTGEQITVYYSIQKFNQLRYQVAEAMKQIYGIQLRTMF